MFPSLKTDIEDRFAEVEVFFRATKGFKGDNAAAAKGLMFVQVYAVYEFTVCSVVRTAIDSIKSHNHKLNDLSPSLMTLFLDPEFKSLRDGSEKDVWKKRLRILKRTFSKDSITLSNDTRVPHDGSNFRYSQLELMFEVFGIKRLPVRRRAHKTRINEVVNHRNTIAHGNETAVEIGRRYTREDIQNVVRQMKSVCLLLVSVFDGYCADSSKQLRR